MGLDASRGTSGRAWDVRLLEDVKEGVRVVRSERPARGKQSERQAREGGRPDGRGERGVLESRGYS